jgi:hypothetical protein
MLKQSFQRYSLFSIFKKPQSHSILHKFTYIFIYYIIFTYVIVQYGNYTKHN